MTRQEIMTVLKIEEIVSLDQVTASYREQLKITNPEDDAEGFMKLRAAFEEAVRLLKDAERKEQTKVAADNQDENEHLVKSIYDAWIDRVHQVYMDLDTRLDLSAWDKVFSEDLCVEIDTSLLAREHLLRYLMRRFRLPFDVWKKIDEVFSIKEDEEELREKFPGDYIDFLLRNMENDNYIYFKGFDQAEGEDVDAFMEKYYELRNAIDEERPINEIKGLYYEVNEFETYHPFIMIEEMRICDLEGKNDQVMEYINDFLESPYLDSYYIVIQVTTCMEKLGMAAEAIPVLRKLLEDFPSYVSGKMLLARCLKDVAEDDYEKGKEVVLFYPDPENEDYSLPLLEAEDILYTLFEHNEGNEETRLLLVDLNKIKLKAYTDRSKTHPEEIKAVEEIAWSLYRTEQYKECIDLIESLPEEQRNSYTCVNVLGRALSEDEQFEKAISFIERWIEMINESPEDGSKEMEHRKEMLPIAQMALASNFYQLGRYEEALSLNLLLIKDETKYGALYYLANLDRTASVYFQMGDYENALSYFNQVLDLDKNIAILLRRQICEYNVGDDQAVIDDYNLVTEYMKEVPLPYVMAVKSFIRHGQIIDARSVIDRAKAAGAEKTLELRYVELALQFEELERKYEEQEKEKKDRSKNNMEYNLLLSELEVIYREGKASEDEIDVAEVVGTMVEVSMAIGMSDYALDKANEIYEYAKENGIPHPMSQVEHVLHQRGLIYERKRQLVNAMKAYREGLVIVPDSVALNYRIANLIMGEHEELEDYIDSWPGEEQSAYLYFLKVYHKSPKFRGILENLTDAYMKEYRDKRDRQYLIQAMSYAKQDVEREETSNSLINYALTLEAAYEYEQAIALYDKAVKLDDSDWVIYNNKGYCLIMLKRYDEAKASLDEAAKRTDPENTALPWRNLASIYFKTKQYEKALDTFMIVYNKYPKSEYIIRRIAECYELLGSYKEAISWYQKLPEGNMYALHGLAITAQRAEDKKLLKSTISFLEKQRRENDGIGSAVDTAELYMLLGDDKRLYQLLLSIRNIKHGSLIRDDHLMCKFLEMCIYYTYSKKMNPFKQFHITRSNDEEIYLFAKKFLLSYLSMEEQDFDAFVAKEYTKDEIEEVFDDKFSMVSRRHITFLKIALVFLALGKVSEAKMCVELAKEENVCEGCRFSSCHRDENITALIHLVEGDIEEAVACYERAFAIWPSVHYERLMTELN